LNLRPSGYESVKAEIHNLLTSLHFPLISAGNLNFTFVQ
jgi:hypothetical protein